MKLKKYKIKYQDGREEIRVLIPDDVLYFTEKSPMGEAIKTGKLVLPLHQGGTHNVVITEVE